MLKAVIYTTLGDDGYWQGDVRRLLYLILVAEKAGVSTLWMLNYVEGIHIERYGTIHHHRISELAALAGIPLLLEKSLAVTRHGNELTVLEYCNITDSIHGGLDIHWDARIPSIVMDRELQNLSRPLLVWVEEIIKGINGMWSWSLPGEYSLSIAVGGRIPLEHVIVSLLDTTLGKALRNI